jgi:hypothetical protein
MEVSNSIWTSLCISVTALTGAKFRCLQGYPPSQKGSYSLSGETLSEIDESHRDPLCQTWIRWPTSEALVAAVAPWRTTLPRCMTT